ISESSYLFVGDGSKSYEFYTLASDHVGNVEPVKFSGFPVRPESEADADVPDRFSLGANYPNPFNPSTTIPFALPETGRVEIVVYNVLGQRVFSIVDAEMKAGRHERHVDFSRVAS